MVYITIQHAIQNQALSDLPFPPDNADIHVMDNSHGSPYKIFRLVKLLRRTW